SNHDFHIRPDCPQLSHQQLQHGASVLGRVDVAGAQVGNQELLAAEDVKRQIAVVVVIAMKEPPFLMAVHRVIGGVEIEHHVPRWGGVGGYKLIDEHFGSTK